MFWMPRGPVPVFVSVAVCGALLWPISVVGKVNWAGVIVGPPALTLLPSTLTVCGLGTALSFTLIVPLSEPSTVGVYVTVTVQDAATARVLGAIGQLLLSTKSDAPV